MGGFDYPNEFTYEAETAFGAGIVGVFALIYLVVLLLSMAFSVATYVLHSLGLYTIAGRRGIRYSWLAWVPVGNLWLLGSISDQYQYVAKGKVKNKRKVLLGLSIAVVAVYVLWFVGLIVGIIVESAVWPILWMLFGALAMMAVAVWLVVFEYMALYDLYRSCDPNNAGLFLVFSILFSVTMPFFVFACRKKDRGMPPKKSVPAEVIPEAAPVAEEPAEEPTEVPVEEGFAQPEEFEEE